MGIVIHMSCDLFKYLLFKQFSLTLSFLSIFNNFWFSTGRQLQNQVSDETLLKNWGCNSQRFQFFLVFQSWCIHIPEQELGRV